MELQTRDFEKTTERVDGMLDLMKQYREKTGQPVVGLIPTGGGMCDQEEIGSRARVHVADAGFPVYPSFRAGAGANALGRVRAYYEELEARTR